MNVCIICGPAFTCPSVYYMFYMWSNGNLFTGTTPAVRPGGRRSKAGRSHAYPYPSNFHPAICIIQYVRHASRIFASLNQNDRIYGRQHVWAQRRHWKSRSPMPNTHTLHYYIRHATIIRIGCSNMCTANIQACSLSINILDV